MKTELLDSLDKSTVRFEVDEIRQACMADPELFDELMRRFLSDRPGAWRAGWVADSINDLGSPLILPYLPRLADHLLEWERSSCRRHALRILARNSLDAELLFSLFDPCLEILHRAEEPVAVKVHAMQLLHDAAIAEPGLREEVMLAIETQMPVGSKGFCARGRKLIASLRKAKP